MDVVVDPVWEAAVADTFGQLRPGRFDDAVGPSSGTIRSADLGRTGAFEVRGTPQVLVRTASSIRSAPGDLLKLCIQRAGTATLRQGEHEVCIGPGEMALYDTGRPYGLRLEGEWRCAVLTLPREALRLSPGRLREAMSRSMSVTAGPAALLASLLDGVAVHDAPNAGPSPVHPPDTHMGEAALHLLAGALEGAVPDGPDDDVVRCRVRAWVRAHAADPNLTHEVVARAHHMSPRTLHRIFADADLSVAALIRETRLEGVRADLADPALARRSIMALASQWGYRDQAHLTRAFRAAFGTTPAAFRRAARPGGAIRQGRWQGSSTT